MPVKILSTIDLPELVMKCFEDKFEVIRGTLASAGDIRPDAVLCSIRPDRFDRVMIEALPKSVKMIATYSVGHDHIDLTAAADREIAVFNTPGVLADAVADAAMLLILGAARRATEGIAMLREGRWDGWSPAQLVGHGLRGKTLGILGLGEIGQRIADRGRGFGMEVAYHNRRPKAPEAGTYYSTGCELLASSDVVVLAWPSSPETRRFITADTLAFAKPSMILINVGRGDLVDDEAVIRALREKQIFAVGLDVFDNEPNLNPGYLSLPNAFLLPHIGSSTWEARVAMANILIDAISAHIAGRLTSNRIA